MSSKKALIVGAGVTGLTAAWRLAERGYQVELVEKEDHIGGQAWTFRHGDFFLDLGPHKIFTVIDYVMDIMREMLGDDLLERPKKGRILINGKFVNFPVGPKDMLTALTPTQSARCMVSFAKTLVLNTFRQRTAANYEEWIVNHFGRAIYQLVVQPCTEKIWGESRTLGVELAETRIRVPRLSEMFKELLLGVKPTRVVNAKRFWYPKYGIMMIPDKLSERVVQHGGQVRTGLWPTQVEVKDGRVSGVALSDGSRRELADGDVMVSTIPKAEFIKLMTVAPDEDTQAALGALRERSLILLYVVVNKPQVSDDNWLFFPENEFVFNRLFEQKNCSEFTCPADKTVLCMEITCREDDPTWRATRDQLFAQAVSNLKTAGLVEPRDIMEHFQVRLPHAYPIWDVHCKGNLETVMDFFDRYDNLYSVGRQGGFIYGGVADCMDMGFVTADFVATGKGKGSWKKEREKFNNYVVID
jgi:protoporphyrinogen oxidase